MKTEDAFALFEHEYDADDGLFTKFRMTTKPIIAFSRVFAG
ncbi:hypothetical protein HY29_17625 [Hyphomonas beringensis]|uniref:Uncharacterized protein n=1 Tax=Hyphomonas beringensis TaxID=1280946 RepID=A0A062U4J4_9PROT|nr:hypothetical protein [Hyphomonas beringensis]KCZ53187.1 hypothetical protein HY29_17625 [Hyphomonas beringensis]